ncbi:MAG: type II secretion system protein [Ruminobacter sp.]|nr:type II secretion system protein [Ruminobacter sp.]
MKRINALHNYFHRGFTLIELVCVIVILGVLVSSAVPKYINVTRDARIARLQALRGAIRSVDQMVYAKSAIQNISRNNDAYDTGTDMITIEGVQYYVKYGHIDRNNIGYFIDGTPKGKIKDEIAQSRTDDKTGYNFSCKTFQGVCEHEWCDCYPGSDTGIPGFENHNSNAQDGSNDAAKATQFFIPRGMEPSKYKTDKCFVAYRQPYKLNNRTIKPMEIGIISDGC